MKEALKLMRKLEMEFEHRFPTSGHPTYDSFVKALRKSSDPYIIKALALVEDGKLIPAIHTPDGFSEGSELAMQRPDPPDIRRSILYYGLQNSHVTKESRGDANVNTRTYVEASLLGLNDSEYQKYRDSDNELKPKAGTLLIDGEYPRTSIYPARRYGQDLWILKEEVQNRIGIFPGDTLNHFWLMPEGTYGSEIYNTGNLNELYIPWKYRLYLVPFIAGGLKKGKGNQPFLEDGWIGQTYQDHHWWEIGFLGPLTINDIKQFIFLQTPPSGEFLTELKYRNIEILDGRDGIPVIWNGQ